MEQVSLLLRLVLSRARAAQLATSVLTKVLSRVCRVAALALRAKSGFYVADRTLVFAEAQPCNMGCWPHMNDGDANVTKLEKSK